MYTWSNGPIAWKLTDGRLLFLALQVTSGIMKFHWYVLEAKGRDSLRVPYVVIEFPLAASSGGP